MKNEFDSEIFHVGNHILKRIIDSQGQGEKDKNGINNTSDSKLFFLIIALLSLTGEEAVKVLFRKDFGLKGLSIYKIILNVILCVGLSVFLFHLSQSNEDFALDTGTSDSHFAGGIFYLIISLAISVKGFLHIKKSIKYNNLSNYTGDSDILSFLAKDRWNQRAIQYGFEPVALLALGVAITIFDRVAGLPIIFCAITIWLSFFVRKQMFGKSQKTELNDLNSSNNSQNFNEVS